MRNKCDILGSAERVDPEFAEINYYRRVRLMKSCPNCGCHLNDEDRFCPVCGEKQEKSGGKKKKRIHVSAKMKVIGICALVAAFIFIVILNNMMAEKRKNEFIAMTVDAVKDAMENDKPFGGRIDIGSQIHVSESENNYSGSCTYSNSVQIESDGEELYMTGGYSTICFNPDDIVNPQQIEHGYESYCKANGEVYCNRDYMGWSQKGYLGVKASDLTSFFYDIYEQIKDTDNIHEMEGAYDEYEEGVNKYSGSAVVYGYLDDTGVVSDLYVSIMELAGDEPSRGQADTIRYEVHINCGQVTSVRFDMGDLARYALYGYDGYDSLETSGDGTFDITYWWGGDSFTPPDVEEEYYTTIEEE